jgi:hypothetical protein
VLIVYGKIAANRQSVGAGSKMAFRKTYFRLFVDEWFDAER